MGLFTKKKKERVPDLSRYNYSQNKSPNTQTHLSEGAASTALRTYSLTSAPYSPSNNGYGSRTNSLRSNTSYNQFKSNSLRGNVNTFQRANSLTTGHQRPLSLNNSRTSSLTSTSYRRSYQGGFNSYNQNNNNPNGPIIIHTTRTEDEYGRTKSITTETIQKFGSFEIVKTETKDILQPPSNKFNKTGGSYAGSILSNDLTSIAEDEEFKNFSETYNHNGNLTAKEKKRMTRIIEPDEEEEEDEQLQKEESPERFDEGREHIDLAYHRLNQPGSRHSSLTNNRSRDVSPNVSPAISSTPRFRSSTEYTQSEQENAPKLRPILKTAKKPDTIENGSPKNDHDEEYAEEDISDDGSVYSDAFDRMPWERQQKKAKKKVQLVDTGSRRSSLTRNSVHNYTPHVVPQKKEPLTKEEMYAKALEVAQRKVYGDDNESLNSRKPNGGFKTYTLRDRTSSIKPRHYQRESQSPQQPHLQPQVHLQEQIKEQESTSNINSAVVAAAAELQKAQEEGKGPGVHAHQKEKKKKKFTFKNLFKSKH